MSVNVGLETSSGGVPFRPSTMPFARVVFPAPRLPMSSTTLSASPAASLLPSSIVSSSECVWNVRDSTNALGEVMEQIRCQHRLFRLMLRGDFAGQRVQVDGGRYGAIRIIGELTDERAHHACQDVAGAAFCHGRRSRWV